VVILQADRRDEKTWRLLRTKGLERKLAAYRGPAMRFILIAATVIVSVVALSVQGTETRSE
jgi:hypothetical protein